MENRKLSSKEAFLKLKLEPFQDLSFAKIDNHRTIRQGIAEVIYGAGKTPQQIIDISDAMLKNGQKTILITRISPEAVQIVEKQHVLTYNELARIAVIGEIPEPEGNGKIIVATGGTSDMPVAEEAAITAEALGNHVTRLYDVGVAGIHRLFANMNEIMSANVIIAMQVWKEHWQV